MTKRSENGRSSSSPVANTAFGAAGFGTSLPVASLPVRLRAIRRCTAVAMSAMEALRGSSSCSMQRGSHPT